MVQVNLKAINALNEGKTCWGIRKYDTWGHGRCREAHPPLQPGTGSSGRMSSSHSCRSWRISHPSSPSSCPSTSCPGPASLHTRALSVSCRAALYWKHRAGSSLGWGTAASLALLGEFVRCLQPWLDHNAEHPRSWMQQCCAHGAQPCSAEVSWGTYHAEPSLGIKEGIIFSVLVRLGELIPICNQKFIDSVRLNTSGKEKWRPLRIYWGNYSST